MSIRKNPRFPTEINALSRELGVYWRELATELNSKFVDAPASATSTGTKGQIAFDSSYLYVCIAADTWKRVAISTW